MANQYHLICGFCNTSYIASSGTQKWCSELCHLLGNAEPYPEDSTKCWLWIGNIDQDGYGRSTFLNVPFSAHGRSHRFFKGPVHGDMVVRHLCHNRPCINPNHLIIGSKQENSNDMTNANRQAKGSDVHTSILTEDQVREIRQLKGSHAAIGRQFNVGPHVIMNIRHNKTWKWLK